MKRSLVISNDAQIARLGRGRLSRDLRISAAKTVRRYKDKFGKRRFQGGRALKSTQCLAQEFTVLIYRLAILYSYRPESKPAPEVLPSGLRLCCGGHAAQDPEQQPAPADRCDSNEASIRLNPYINPNIT